MRLKEYFHDIYKATDSDVSNRKEHDYEKHEFRKPSTFTPKPNREPALDLYLKHLVKSTMQAKLRKTYLIEPK